MRFMVVNRPVKADIFGETYDLKPLNARGFDARDILVSDNGSSGELLEKHSSVLMAVSFDPSTLPNFPAAPTTIEGISPGSKVFVLKAGGVGDHVMFLPALKAFKEALPDNVEVWLATQKEKRPIFHLHPGIDRLLSLPLGLDQLIEADFVIDFSDPLNDMDFNSLNMTDYYLRFFGLNEKNCADKTPSIPPNTSRDGSRLRAAIHKLRKEARSKRLIVLQCRSSNLLRNLPACLLTHLAESFPDIGFVSPTPLSEEPTGGPALPGQPMNLKNVSAFVASLEEYMTLIELCDGVVSTDTAAYHLAEAYGKPSLALFGPISSDLRIRYYRKALAIDASYEGKTCSAPCGLHKTRAGCPEAIALGLDYSPCLLSIQPANIRRVFNQMCNSFYSNLEKSQ